MIEAIVVGFGFVIGGVLALVLGAFLIALLGQ